MKAMILAAGRGERLRPLTDTCPKPLLDVGGKALIAWHIERLARVGVCDLVINIAHLGEQIPKYLGTGASFGVNIAYSHEKQGALETAGGIATALNLLGDAPFLLVNGDVWTDYDFAKLKAHDLGEKMAHLVLVDNPEHHPSGDFVLRQDGFLQAKTAQDHTLTFAGLSKCSPILFADLPKNQAAKLAPLLLAAMAKQHISGEHFCGRWLDVGTPERLAQARAWATA